MIKRFLLLVLVLFAVGASALGMNLALNKFVDQSSCYNDNCATYGGQKLVDGNNATLWYADQAPRDNFPNVTLDLNDTYSSQNSIIHIRNGAVLVGSQLYIYSSANNATWTLVYANTTLTNADYIHNASYTTASGRYWRIVINGSTDVAATGYEWYLYEGGNYSTLLVDYPANTTYYNASVPYSFQYQNSITGEAPGTGENETCGYWLNNALTWLGNQTNSTPITGTLTVANGAHNFTAFCGNATGGNTTSTNWFTVSDEPMNFTFASGQPCPTGYNIAANLSFYDEESVNATVNSSMDATFTFYNATHGVGYNVTVNVTNTAFVLLCFVNNSQQYYMDSFQSYQGANPTQYNQRNWFINNASITPVTQVNVSLFNANATTTKNTKITFKDQNGLKISGAFITAQRYYPGSNSYLGVAMVRTDNAGEAVTYLVPNLEFYRFTTIENYEVTATFTSQQIVCDPGLTQCLVTLQKGGGELPGYWQYYDQITSNCGFIAATNISYCTFTDASGTFNYYEYTVLKLGIKNHEVICQTNTTASSGTLTCNTTGYGYGEYTGSLIGHGSTDLIAGHDFVNGGLTSLFGTSVAFLAVLLVPTIIFAVAASPAAALLFAGASVLISAMVGLLVIDSTTIAALVIIGLLVAWKVKQ